MTIESRKDIQEALLNSRPKQSSDHKIRDICDGLEYKKLSSDGGILSDKNNFSLTVNTDGAPVFESSKCSIWPLQFFINELPADIRFKAENVLLAGLWFGAKDPRMDVFMIPFMEEALSLHNTGFNWKKQSGETVTSKVVTLCCCLDSVARPMVQGIKQFNGYYGCSYCLHPGKNVDGSCVRFTESGQPSHEERTDSGIRKDMRKAVKKGKIVNGVKSMSPFYILPSFNLVYGFVIDYMHCVLLSVTRTMANLWLDSANHYQPYYICLSAGVVDNRLKSITPPSKVTRFPRPISQRSAWKANEWRNWLLFYSLPCLKGVRPKKYYEHFAVLVLTIYCLLGEEISFEDVDYFNNAMDKFLIE